MAVIEECPGLKAEIAVDRRPLREHDDDEEERVPNVTTKYIEARSGQEFALKWKFKEPFQKEHGVKIRFKIDGEEGKPRVYPPEDLFRRGGYFKDGSCFKKDGDWYRQNYRFTALNIVEEGANASQVQAFRRDIESKGTISLRFFYITDMLPKCRAGRGSSVDRLHAMGQLPEKALKGDARSHQTTLGEPYKIAPRKPGWEYDYVSWEPFATFHFKYRSRAALKALRIIRDEDAGGNANALPPEERLEESMTVEELRETVRRMRRQEGANRPVKQEGVNAGRVKRERAVENVDEEDDDEITIVETRQKRPRRDPEVIVLE